MPREPLAALAFLLLSLHSTAQPIAAVTPTAVATPVASTAPNPIVTVSDREEVVALRAQNDLMRLYDQRLLTTVYWALGAFVVLVGVLVGFGWFANFRVYERDKTIMGREIRADVDGQLVTIRKELEDEIGKRFSEISSQLKSEIKTARDSILKDVKDSISRLRRDLNLLRYESLKAEVEKWRNDEVPANALLTQVEVLELALQMEDEFKIGRSLDEITKTLDSFPAKDLEAELSKDLSTTLERVPAAYAVAKSGIRTKLTKLTGGDEKA